MECGICNRLLLFGASEDIFFLNFAQVNGFSLFRQMAFCIELGSIICIRMLKKQSQNRTTYLFHVVVGRGALSFFPFHVHEREGEENGMRRLNSSTDQRILIEMLAGKLKYVTKFIYNLITAGRRFIINKYPTWQYTQ